jgi:hypothetical protein
MTTNLEENEKQSLSFYDIQQQVHQAPPPPKQKAPLKYASEPTLSIYLTTDPKGYGACLCTISKAMLQQLPNVKASTSVTCGTRVLLVVPSKRGGNWYLDTRPKPGAGVYFRLNKKGGAAARVQPISRTHFQASVLRFVGDFGSRRIASSANTLARGIKLTLGPELVDNPGYYRLLPLELTPEAKSGHEEHPQSW